MMFRKFLLVSAIGFISFILFNSSRNFSAADISAAAPAEIEWTDLGEQAWYPGVSGISEGQSVVVNDKLYVFGGYEQCCFPVRKAYMFDPVQNRWSPLRNLPQGTTHTGIATDGKDIYLAGGYVELPEENYRTVGSEKFWRYNIVLDTYTALPNLPTKASTGQLAYLDGKLHYIGGTPPVDADNLPDLPDHYIFDLEAYTQNPAVTDWVDITSIAPLPNPRQHAGAVVLDGYIYYVGGQKFHNNSLVPQKDLHRYDPQTQIWTRLADMPKARNHMSNTIIVYAGKIIVMGGQLNHQVPKSEVFAYDPVTNTWSELTPLPLEQFSAIGGVINGIFYFGTGDIGYNNNERRRMRKGIPSFTEVPEPTSTPSEENLLKNSSFEADTDLNKQPDSWKLKNGSGDKQKCNKSGKPPIAFDGQCAYQFKGGGDVVALENARLQQTVVLTALDFEASDKLILSFYLHSFSPVVTGNVATIIKYTDGSAKTKSVIALDGTDGYELRTSELSITTSNVMKVKVQINHSSAEGKLRLDNMELRRESGSGTAIPLALPVPSS
jgi:hypothetical protein